MPSRSAPCVLYCVSVPCACLSAVRVPFAGRSRGMAVSSGRALPRGSQSPRFESPRVELGDRPNWWESGVVAIAHAEGRALR